MRSLLSQKRRWLSYKPCGTDAIIYCANCTKHLCHLQLKVSALLASDLFSDIWTFNPLQLSTVKVFAISCKFIETYILAFTQLQRNNPASHLAVEWTIPSSDLFWIRIQVDTLCIELRMNRSNERKSFYQVWSSRQVVQFFNHCWDLMGLSTAAGTVSRILYLGCWWNAETKTCRICPNKKCSIRQDKWIIGPGFQHSLCTTSGVNGNDEWGICFYPVGIPMLFLHFFYSLRHLTGNTWDHNPKISNQPECTSNVFFPTDLK